MTAVIAELNSTSHVMSSNVGTFFFNTIGATTTDLIDSISTKWDADPQYVNGVKIVPWGTNNNLPKELRDIMESNHLAPGILKREQGLLWGQGPYLYSEEFSDDGSTIYRKWLNDSEIQSFLDDIDYKELIASFLVEYKYIGGFFAKYYRNRGARIGGKSFINGIEFEASENCRLGWVDSRKLKDVNKIYVGNWDDYFRHTGVKSYSRFDKRDPFRYPVAMQYHNMYSFGRDLYALADFWGSKNWIQRSSDIPRVLKALTDNSMTPTYMVKVPSEYWEARKEELQQKYKNSNDQFTEDKFKKLQADTFKKVEEVLAGKTNVGKFFSTVSFADINGNRVSWEIEPIEFKAKEYIESQLKIGERADANTISGISVHPTLANSPHDGKSLSSGSENLYAFKVYLASDTSIPETFIMKPINDAIRINFPGKRVKIGFYHNLTQVKREEDITPDQRLSNKQ